jgi:hypothetical protein
MIMKRPSRTSATVAVGLVLFFWTSGVSNAQTGPRLTPVALSESSGAGSIGGVVEDERGAGIGGAVVSALGPTTAVAVSDRAGRFELRTLPAGAYLLRAHVNGFASARPQLVDVRPRARASSSISLRRLDEASAARPPVLAAGVGVVDADTVAPNRGTDGSPAPAEPSTTDVAQDETTWRLRHARRGVLKDVALIEGMLSATAPPDTRLGPAGLFDAPAASSSGTLFGRTLLSGQVNLLTAGSFDSPQELFSAGSFSKGIAHVSLGAPIGDADWMVRAAMMQGDFSSWIVAGAYTSRAPADHVYTAGMSYSTQRYEDSNLAPLRDVVNGSRSVGTLYAYDTVTLAPAIVLNYGGTFAHYDYLDDRGLFSPRAALTISPNKHLHLTGTASLRTLAPGAEEFAPRPDGVLLLPPQRAFAAIHGQTLQAERTNHLEARLDGEIGSTTVTVRAFRQHVDDQLVALFGLNAPPANAARLGRYFVANTGAVDAAGYAAGVSARVTPYLRGGIEYATSNAQVNAGADLGEVALIAPSAVRSGFERVHDVHARVEGTLPSSDTRVLVLYRMSNAFSIPDESRSGFDARFDVQLRQSLPFLDFGGARWEMLLAVRNLFRETAADASIYDELLVVRPPKRIVGGLTMRF